MEIQKYDNTADDVVETTQHDDDVSMEMIQTLCDTAMEELTDDESTDDTFIDAEDQYMELLEKDKLRITEHPQSMNVWTGKRFESMSLFKFYKDMLGEDCKPTETFYLDVKYKSVPCTPDRCCNKDRIKIELPLYVVEILYELREGRRIANIFLDSRWIDLYIYTEDDNVLSALHDGISSNYLFDDDEAELPITLILQKDPYDDMYYIAAILR